jgi:sulfur carrier protein
MGECHKDAGLNIVLNGEELATSARSVADLVERHALAGMKVATALNGSFVPEAQRATTALKPGDRIEIVSPRQGG